MATQFILPASHQGSAVASGAAPTATLSTNQTGTGASTNVADRGGQRGPAVLEIVTTVGATPSATVAIEGSMDGGDWYPISHSADPVTAPAIGNLTITTATLTRRFLPTDQAWRYLRLNYSANTNVTFVSAELHI